MLAQFALQCSERDSDSVFDMASDGFIGVQINSFEARRVQIVPT